jgi:16S rRNA (uracil1498-N3)-methyltransferase
MAELCVTSWRPVLWKRSRSVSPRGEGPGFQGKVRARMVAALEQSGNAWLPALYPDATIDRAMAALAGGKRLVLDSDGTPITRALSASGPPIVIAIGPEGGFEPAEIDALIDAGFQRTSLGPMTLRFETAGIAALAHVRAHFADNGE